LHWIYPENLSEAGGGLAAWKTTHPFFKKRGSKGEFEGKPKKALRSSKQKNLVQERGHWRGYQDRNGTSSLNYLQLAETDASFESRPWIN